MDFFLWHECFELEGMIANQTLKTIIEVYLIHNFVLVYAVQQRFNYTICIIFHSLSHYDLL